MISRKLNERTGHQVIDDDRHEEWRQAYYKRVSDQRGHVWQQIQDAIQKKNLGSLNILTTKQVAEMFNCCQGTAYLWMRNGVIPAFQLGSRWYTHDYVVDAIFDRFKKYVNEGDIKKEAPRLVWKLDKGTGQ